MKTPNPLLGVFSGFLGRFSGLGFFVPTLIDIHAHCSGLPGIRIANQSSLNAKFSSPPPNQNEQQAMPQQKIQQRPSEGFSNKVGYIYKPLSLPWTYEPLSAVMWIQIRSSWLFLTLSLSLSSPDGLLTTCWNLGGGSPTTRGNTAATPVSDSQGKRLTRSITLVHYIVSNIFTQQCQKNLQTSFLDPVFTIRIQSILNWIRNSVACLQCLGWDISLILCDPTLCKGLKIHEVKKNKDTLFIGAK